MTLCRYCLSPGRLVVVRAGDRGEGTGWMAAAGAALAVANATAYSSALLDPVVLPGGVDRRPARWEGGGPAVRDAF